MTNVTAAQIKQATNSIGAFYASMLHAHAEGDTAYAVEMIDKVAAMLKQHAGLKSRSAKANKMYNGTYRYALDMLALVATEAEAA